MSPEDLLAPPASNAEIQRALTELATECHDEADRNYFASLLNDLDTARADLAAMRWVAQNRLDDETEQEILSDPAKGALFERLVEQLGQEVVESYNDPEAIE